MRGRRGNPPRSQDVCPGGQGLFDRVYVNSPNHAATRQILSYDVDTPPTRRYAAEGDSVALFEGHVDVEPRISLLPDRRTQDGRSLTSSAAVCAVRRGARQLAGPGTAGFAPRTGPPGAPPAAALGAVLAASPAAAPGAVPAAPPATAPARLPAFPPA